MTTFSEWAWSETASLRGKIIGLPFNRELAGGVLSEERFRFYMLQDALYLEQYSRTLAICAAKAPDAAAMQCFGAAAVEALVVERALHSGFFEKYGIGPEAAAAVEPSPTCAAYTNFLLSIAHVGSYAELAAAVLPCLWIYWDTGKQIAAESTDDNPYAAWIETYSDPAFGEEVEAVISITDRTADAATEDQRVGMLETFKRSSQYEWMFWDSAYHLETWPVEA